MGSIRQYYRLRLELNRFQRLFCPCILSGHFISTSLPVSPSKHPQVFRA